MHSVCIWLARHGRNTRDSPPTEATHTHADQLQKGGKNWSAAKADSPSRLGCLCVSDSRSAQRESRESKGHSPHRRDGRQRSSRITDQQQAAAAAAKDRQAGSAQEKQNRLAETNRQTDRRDPTPIKKQTHTEKAAEQPTKQPTERESSSTVLFSTVLYSTLR